MRFSSFSRRSFFIVTFKSAQCLQPREVAMIHRHPSDRCHCHVLNVSHHVTNIHQDTSCLKEDVWVSKWEHPNSPSMSKFDGAHGEQWTLGTHRFWTWSFEKAVLLWSRHLVANLGVLPKRLPQNGQHSVNLTCCQNLGSLWIIIIMPCNIAIMLPYFWQSGWPSAPTWFVHRPMPPKYCVCGAKSSGIQTTSMAVLEGLPHWEGACKQKGQTVLHIPSHTITYHILKTIFNHIQTCFNQFQSYHKHTTLVETAASK